MCICVFLRITYLDLFCEARDNQDMASSAAFIVHEHTHTCMHENLCVNVYIHIYIYTNVYMYIYLWSIDLDLFATRAITRTWRHLLPLLYPLPLLRWYMSHVICECVSTCVWVSGREGECGCREDADECVGRSLCGVYVCVFVCVRACICVRLCVCIYVHIFTHRHKQNSAVSLLECLCAYKYEWPHMYIWIYICICIWICLIRASLPATGTWKAYETWCSWWRCGPLKLVPRHGSRSVLHVFWNWEVFINS